MEIKTKTFPDFIAEHGIQMQATPVAHRPRLVADVDSDDWDGSAFHWHIELTRTRDARSGADIKPRPFWSGYYSAGSGHAESWVRDGAKLSGTRSRSDSQARTAWRQMTRKPGPFARGLSIHDSGLLDVIRDRFHKAAPLDPADILESLQADSSGADESFKDWADCLGYETDSRKAESIWRACRETALTIENAIGGAAFRAFLEIEPE